jgi:hypothetical protein
MAGHFDLEHGGRSHPALLQDTSLAKGSYPSEPGNAVHDWFPNLTERLFEIMSSQFVPQTSPTLASLIKDLQIYVASRVIVHIKRYEGWVKDIFPLKEAPALFFRQKIWSDVPQLMDENPEGVAPQVMMTKWEDYSYALRRYNIGNKAKHEAFMNPEGLRDWLFKTGKYPDAFFGTAELAAFDAIDYHPSAYKRQMDAQGHRKHYSVAQALAYETETYLIGLKPKGPYELFHMVNSALVGTGAAAQLPFNRMVLSNGASQMIAHSAFETDPLQRGERAIRNLEGGGVAWRLAGMPDVVIYEAAKINYVNFASEYEPLKRTSGLSTFFMIDGRSSLRFNVDRYEPEGELSVMVRDSTVNGLRYYGYESALRDCHRFGDDGYIDTAAHEGMLMRLPTMMRKQGFQMYRQQDLDPFVWHHPTEPVDPTAPGYHVCELYGDVAEGFRGHQVDDKHGAAFSAMARETLGEDAAQKLDALREVVARLEKPPAALWAQPGGDPARSPLVRYLTAIARGEGASITEGAFDIPDREEGWPDLPYGNTTIAGIRALARRYEAGAGDWPPEAVEMFRKANDAWPVLKRLWHIVRHVYPECILVQSGRFVPEWMQSESDDMNAMYSVFANFFDARVRYPVWLLGGDAAPLFNADDLANLRLRFSEARLEALNSGLIQDTVAGHIRRDAVEISDAYETYIGPAYKALVERDAPDVDVTLESFVAREIDPPAITVEQKAQIMRGILDLAQSAVHDGDRVQDLTRDLITYWKNRRPQRARREPAAAEPPVRAGPVAGVNTRLSFHPSVWKMAVARALGDYVAPADPTQRDRPLPVDEDGFNFARSAMPFMPRRGTYFAPLETRTRAAAYRPVEQDLGSLDELDADQMLYPHLYQEDTGILWKFQKTGPDDGRYVPTYYFWHRLQHVRSMEPDPFAKLGIMCLLFSRISMMADLACVASELPPPDLCFMGIHFMIRQRTQGVVIARGGGVAGNTFWKNLDTLVGVNTINKEWYSHFSAWMATGVTDPRYVVFHRDFLPAGGITGYDISSVPTDFTMEQVGLDKSLIVWYAGSEFTRDRARGEYNPWPLSGRFDGDYMGDINFDDLTEQYMLSPDKTPAPPGFWFYAYKHNLQDMHRMQKWTYDEGAAGEMKFRYFPGIVYFEEHVGYSGNGKYKNRFEGTGHTRYWPDNISDISNGTHVFHQTTIKT